MDTIIIPGIVPPLCAILGLLLIWRHHQTRVSVGLSQAVDIFNPSGIRMYLYATPENETCSSCKKSQWTVFLPTRIRQKDFSPLAQLPLGELGHSEFFMRGEAGLLERMREGVMADVVQQRRHPYRKALFGAGGPELAQLLQRRERAPGQMECAECVLEAAVGGAGIDQESVTDLTDVAEALNGGSVQGQERGLVDPDVVPERVADDFSLGRALHAGP